MLFYFVFIFALFPCVLQANLLCRVPDPGAFLSCLSNHLQSGGVVVLVSPYSWLPAHTEKTKWIGGTPEFGRGEGAVKQVMLRHGFKLLFEKVLNGRAFGPKCGMSNLGARLPPSARELANTILLTSQRTCLLIHKSARMVKLSCCYFHAEPRVSLKLIN